MTAITTRAAKGSALTHGEADNNFTNLNNDKLEKGLFATNHTILIRDNSGNVVEVVVGEDRIVGRKAGGQITALTAAEIQTLIGLTSLLNGKQDVVAILTEIAAITAPSTGDTIMYTGSAWTKVTKAQFKSNMAMAFGDVSRKCLGIKYDSASTTTISAATTWTDVDTGAPTVKKNVGFTVVTNKITITDANTLIIRWNGFLVPAATADRRIQVSLSHYDDADSLLGELAMFDNTVEPYNANSGRVTAFGEDVESFSAGDYLKIRVRNVDNDDDVILSEIKVIVEQI